MQTKNIHWFPGHMKKALSDIKNCTKIVDISVVILDARAPRSSSNKALEDALKDKKKLYVLAKSDLCDPKYLEKNLERYWAKGIEAIAINLKDKHAGDILKDKLIKMGEPKWEKEKSLGMKPQPLKTMIVGIPNVGKSTLINKLVKKRKAIAQDKPGQTLGQQWIKLESTLWLLDTPGILPSQFPNINEAMNVAFIGSIKQSILPNSRLAENLLRYMDKYYPHLLMNRYGEKVYNHDALNDFFINLMKERGFQEVEKAETTFLYEFKKGIVGQTYLEIEYEQEETI